MASAKKNTANVPAFTGRDVPISEIAKATGIMFIATSALTDSCISGSDISIRNLRNSLMRTLESQ